jgi:hypothetical protein
MDFKQQQSQLDEAEKFFAASKRDVAPRSTFADELEQKLVDKYITSYHRSHMSEQKFNLPSWAFGLAGVAFTLVAIFAVLSFTGNGIPFLTPNNTANSSSLPASISGEIAYIEGQTEFRNGDNGWKAAEAGTTLVAGDSIRTFAEARAIINLDDGSALRLNGNSQITLAQLDPQKIVIANDSGEVYARVASLDREFAVIAGDMKYQSLGTAYTTFNEEGVKGVKVYHSKVKVNDNAEVSFEKVVSEGEEFYKQNKNNKNIEGKIDKLELSEIKKDAFALWNKDQDEKSGTKKEDLGKLGDLVAPKLTILSPKMESTTENSKVTVKGATDLDAKIYVAGKEVANQSGNFSKEVSLSAGLNKITVKVMDANGNTASQTLKVTYQVDEPTPSTGTTAGIVITSISQVSDGLKVQWQVNGGLDVSQGFKLVYNKTGNPTYGVDSGAYYDKSTDRAGVVYKKDGNTYYVRVCRYTGSGCDNYSNVVSKTAPSVASSSSAAATISSITLNASGANLSWTTNTGTAGQGFKILYSASSSSLSYANKIDFTNGFVYTANATGYWAICAYYNGTCSAVSNVEQITIP